MSFETKTCLRTQVKVIVLGIALAACAALPAFADTPAIGQKFPELQTFKFDGALPDLSNARVIIVDFWASWCAPCKASFPVFNELQREYGSKGVVIIGVSVDDNIAKMNAFVQKAHPGFSVVRDIGQKLAMAANPPKQPTTFVLDGKGVVRFMHAGFDGEKSRRAFVEQINSLLSESK